MARDLYSEVTAKIISAMEADGGRWIKPWRADGSAASIDAMPINGVTGHEYRGVNIPMLWFAARHHGYATNRWATFNQWKDKGASVRKGEKGTEIVFFKTLEKESATRVDASGNPSIEKIPLLRSWHVFNASQVEGLADQPAEPIVDDSQRDARADAFVAATRADIRHGGNRAFYAGGTARDFIQMPFRSAFIDTGTSTAIESYYSTLLHELTHWTGADSRCNRQFGKRFGDQAYAAEELVAELGAAFLCAHLGVTNEPRPDHAKYLNSWIEVLKADKRAIFTAASKASAAADYLREFSKPAAIAAEQIAA